MARRGSLKVHPTEFLRLLEPDAFHETAAVKWFADIAASCIHDAVLMVAGHPHKIVELEAYYCGPRHGDPFTHNDPHQLSCGEWYFHRTGLGYRGGTYKGLDLTFGSADSYGGLLVRSIQTPKRAIINGPSLCVDYLLGQTQAESVAELADKLSGDSHLLELLPATACSREPIINTARVGLTLKKANSVESPRVKYLLQRYRFHAQPQKIPKGRTHTILALLLDGCDEKEIRQRCNATPSKIARCIAQFLAGQEMNSIAEFIGKNLSMDDLCKLHGYESATLSKGRN
jgi:hypothetical protein